MKQIHSLFKTGSPILLIKETKGNINFLSSIFLTFIFILLNIFLGNTSISFGQTFSGKYVNGFIETKPDKDKNFRHFDCLIKEDDYINQDSRDIVYKMNTDKKPEKLFLWKQIKEMKVGDN